MAWFRTDGRAPVSPTLRRAWGYWESLNRAPLAPLDRLACMGVLGKWAGERAGHWISRRFALTSGPVSVAGGAAPAGAHPYVAAR
jgi:hypothetical protein